jgi:hypothetical protein
MKKARVEILYFEDCLNYAQTPALVERIAAELGIEPDIRLIDVPDPETAQRMRFLGSPTVRIDGIDVEPHADQRHDYVQACRVYRTDAGFAGQPQESWIRGALKAAAAGP